mmetsp:Transcript_27928/g.43098  ORF Transcript_27928/g.43098 Transcript_27928/m.43098 type:complete len:201 (+) Transcript_27928:431-1033(+)
MQSLFGQVLGCLERWEHFHLREETGSYPNIFHRGTFGGKCTSVTMCLGLNSCLKFDQRVTEENIQKWKRELREKNPFTFEAGHSATNNESSSNNLPYLDNEGTRSCAICLEEYVRGEEFAVTNECKHVFHSECIFRWLEQHYECPICRKQVVNSTQIKETLQLHNITEAFQLPSIHINRSESDTDGSEISASPAPDNEVV